MYHRSFKQETGLTWLLAAAGILLLLMMWMVFIQKDKSMDEAVFAFTEPRRTDARTSCMRVITFLGNYQFLTPANLLLVLLLFYRKQKTLALTALVVALSSLLLKIGLKELFHRPRPEDPLISGIVNFSFPSGHALMSVAFYGLLIWLLPRFIKNKGFVTGLTLFLLLLILLIGFSRIYLRVHYASDVIAGYCIGIIWLYCCLLLTKRWRNKQQLSPKHS